MRAFATAASMAILVSLLSFSASGQSNLIGNPVANAKKAVQNQKPIMDVVLKNNAGMTIRACYQTVTDNGCSTFGNTLTLGQTEVHEMNRADGNEVSVEQWVPKDLGKSNADRWEHACDLMRLPNAPTVTVNVTGTGFNPSCKVSS